MAISRKTIMPVIPDGETTEPVVSTYGATSIQDQVNSWILEGRVYWYNRGVVTSPISFTQTTVVYARPSIALRVPLGKSVIPCNLSVQVETASGSINELMWVACNNDVGAGTSTGVTALRGNMRGDIAGNVGGCSINITYTGDVTTAATNPYELKRWNQPFIDAIGASAQHHWDVDIRRDSCMPLLVGPATLFLIGGGSAAPTGYVQLVYAEFNSADLGL